jgi:hypothetical protein
MQYPLYAIEVAFCFSQTRETRKKHKKSENSWVETGSVITDNLVMNNFRLCGAFLGFFAGVVFFFSACRSFGQELPPSPLTAEEQRAIALSGFMAEMNHHSHTTLSFGKMTDADKKDALRVLSRDWGITTRDELLSTIRMMELDGHAAALAEIKETVREHGDGGDFASGDFNPADFDRYFPRERDRNYLRYVAKNWDYYKDHTIVAWDWGRNIALARWGYEVGFLTADEAWEIIFHHARKIWPLYQSWEEYGTDYCRGRVFWASGFQSEKTYTLQTNAIYGRLTRRGGLWSHVEWPLPGTSE